MFTQPIAHPRFDDSTYVRKYITRCRKYCIDKIEIKGKADESSISSTQIPNKNILYFSDKINRILHVEGAKDNEILSVYDLNGKLCLQIPIKNKECYINLPSGLYIGIYDNHVSKIVVP